VNEEHRAENMASAMRRGLPVCDVQKPNGRRIAIVGSAPSVTEYLDELRSFDGDVLAINGALDYLIENGVKVWGWFGIDPQAGLTKYLKKKPDVRYFVASMCDPAVFDALKDRDVSIVHLKEDNCLEPSVPGGTVAITRAPYFALQQGYRDITIYGADASYGEAHHCYGAEPERDDTAITVRVGNKSFRSDATLVSQCSEFGAMAEIFSEQNYKLDFRVGGMLEAFLAEPIQTLAQIRAANG